MSVVIQTNRTVDLNQQPIRKTELPNVFVKGNNLAHEFNISVRKNGTEESLAAGSCLAIFVNASRQTVLVEGSVSSNVATVTLNDACYAVAGRFYLVINATVGGVTQAVFYGVGAIAPGETDVVIDPDDIVPSLAELLAMVDGMETLSNSVTAAEVLRVSAEAARVAADGFRDTAEGDRETAEELRDTAEGDRETAEGLRDTAETERVSAENDRDTAEDLRNTAESDRETAEGLRGTAEGLRDIAEGDRVTAEGLRVTAENGRVSAETLRETNTAQAISDCEDATDIALAASTHIKALDQFDTYADMVASVPSPIVGESVYAVGTSYPYDIWVYMASGWKNFGPITGPNTVSTATETNITGPLWGDGANVRRGIAGTDFASPGGTVNVCDYSATGDGSTDDTAAINAAINATEVGQTLYFPFGTYDVSEAIEIAKEINVVMDGIINYTGSDDIAVLTIQSGSAGNFTSRRLVLRAQRETVSDWTDEASISIKLVNCNQCDITIMEARASTIGVQFLGDGHGFAYNTITLGYLDSNKYGVDCANINGGWCNENIYQGGRFSVGTSVHTSLARYGVRIRSIDDGFLNDQNVFHKPSFEIGSSTGGVESIPVLIDKGMTNYFLNCRIEGCGNIAMRDYLYRNYMSVSSTDHTYDMVIDSQDENNVDSCLTMSVLSMIREQVPNKIFDSGPIAKRAASYGSSTLVHVPGMFAIRWSDGSYQRVNYANLYDDYIDYDGFLGVFVETKVGKRFMIARDPYDYETGMQVCIRPLDANMNILDGSSTRYVKWDQYYLGWQATQSLYMFSVDNSDDFFFQVTDDVKYIFVGVSRKYKSWALFANRWVSPFCPYDTLTDPNVAVAAPVIGTYELGRRLVNVDPTASVRAWVCTDAGTGDAISTTCTADESEVIAVASATGILVGRYIQVAGGDRRRVVAVDGTSITLDDTVAAGSGLAVANYAMTWTEELSDSDEETIVYDKLVFNSGPICKLAGYYGTTNWEGHDKMHIPGMLFYDPAAYTLSKAFWGVIYSDHVYISDNYFGVLVKTSVAKDFMLYREFPDEYSEGSILVVPFDADMAILNGSGSALITSEASTLSWSSGFQGYSGSDNAVDYDIHVAASVKYVFIGVSRYYRIRAVQIYSDENTCAYSPFDTQGQPNAAIAAPVIGTWLAGRRFTADTPSSGNPKGWICTVAGTSDTISTTCTADDSAVVVVADATGLDVGMFISINSGATQRIVKVEGTSITMDSAVTAGSGLTFVNSPATWVSEGNL